LIYLKVFTEIFKKYNWEDVQQQINNKTSADVERALARGGRGSVNDFMALISPAAEPYLETMAQLSYSLTRKRFGNTIQMYIPMYLSNECQNICTYCGFRYDNKIARIVLNDKQIIQEVEAVKALGFEHILLVTGEATERVGVEYLSHAIELVRNYFDLISIEVQPLDADEYRTLVGNGLHSVLVYQETYNERDYKTYHPKGKKSNFRYRLETPDRIGSAGAHKIGLGVLLGLEDWRTDSFFTALHLSYLEKKYWKTKYSISFPRLRPAVGMEQPKYESSNRDLVQLICAYRIFNEDIELSLSTREEATFRDHLFSLGITSVSAGSKTNPGGYEVSPTELEQFEIDDHRTPKEVAAAIRSKGFEPVWKDWERAFHSIEN
jgi:2-iminoacetate synthase